MQFSVLYLICLFHLINGQYSGVGPSHYCSDLDAKNDVNIQQIFGTWFGKEIITHRDRISGEKSNKACVYVVITEISHEQFISSRPPSQYDSPYGQQYGAQPGSQYGAQPGPQYGSQPGPQYNSQTNSPHNPQPGSRYGSQYGNDMVTQLSPRGLPPNAMNNFRYLRLEWTEQNEKLEYYLRYNSTRRGFWMSGAPIHRQSQYMDREQPNYGSFTGTIQVIEYDRNFLVLTFCESVPQQQLFSIILSRRMNYMNDDTLRNFRTSLRSRNLPTIYERKVCNGSNFIYGSLATLIVSLLIVLSY